MRAMLNPLTNREDSRRLNNTQEGSTRLNKTQQDSTRLNKTFSKTIDSTTYEYNIATTALHKPATYSKYTV